MADVIRVLYVDDEENLLEIGKLFLEESGEFLVTTLESATAAIDLLKKEKFDAIISDYQMPRMDGIQFLVEVRKQFGPIPFILFTGKGREEVVIQAINNGADFYLQKGGMPDAQFAELAHKLRLAVERVNAFLLIRDHERREADIINFQPDATFAIDTHGVVIAWNRAMEEMTGVKAKDMLGKGNYEYSIPIYNKRRPILIDLVLDEDPDIVAKYPNLKKNGVNFVAEAQTPTLYNGRGATIWFTAAPLYNNEGEIVGAIESIRDITDRKRDEEKLRESSERYKSLITVSNTGAWEYNSDNDYLWCSPEYFSMLGRDLSQFDFSGAPNLKETWTDLLHPIDRDNAVMTFTKYLDSGSPGIYGSIFRLQHSLGHWVWIWSRGWTLRNGSGALTSKTIGTHIDITSSRESEEAVIINNERLHMAQKISQTGSWELDLETGNIWASEEAFRIFGFPQPADGIVSIDDVEARIPERKRVHDALTALIENGADYNIEYVIEPADNSGRKIVHSVARILYDVNNKPARVAGVIHDITTRKKTEGALRESQDLFRSLVENIQDSIIIISFDGIILFANPAVLRLIGLPSLEISENISIASYLDTESLSQAISDLKEIKRTGGPLLTEYYINPVKGEKRCVEAYGVRIVYKGYEADLVSLRDITDRKKAEVLVRQNQERYRQVVENANEAIVIAQDSYLVYANPKTLEMLATSSEMLLSRPFIEFIHPDDRQLVFDRYQQRVLGEEVTDNYDFRLLGMKGDITWVHISSVRIEWNGKPATLNFLTNITGLKLTEKALFESEYHLKSIIRVAPIGIGFASGRILRTVNDRFCEMTGYPAEELIDKSVRFIYPTQEEYDQVGKDLYPLIEQYGSGSIETRWQKKDGTIINVQLSSTQLDPKDLSVGVIFTALDITERKRAEEQAVQSRDEWERTFNTVPDLISIIDPNFTIKRINHAMAAKIGLTPEQAVGRKCYQCVHGTQKPSDSCPHVRLLKDHKEHTAEIEPYLQKIYDSTKDIEYQIDFSKDYQELGLKSPEWLNLSDMVNYAKTPAIQIIDETQNLEIFADPLFAKVFYNLMDNTVRHGETATQVNISLISNKDDLQIIWTDNGVGIPEDKKEQIFQEGFGKNTGFGLFFIREILAITRMTIKETGVPGKGARLEITVPNGMYRIDR